ncbi:hypothetical protein SAMN05216312_102199 [Cohnella sp. OV330]|uniref:hypothetical protein n=1 Tax=Cohnella sp. OV330 TaxID=1855288 RepID=UPI0008E66C95|nr:hypothetical protein [Cohnella sp. OV330]SFA91280.1 hypothetical protein SAMN05216312_102199 [Cohnella sp. OV330]
MEKRTVYRLRYTLDNRIKSVEATQEPAGRPRDSKAAGWIVVAVGVVLCVIWWFVW